MEFDFSSFAGTSSTLSGIQGLGNQAGALASGTGNSTLGNSISASMQPLSEAATIAGALTLNPIAIGKLITNPQAAIDFVKNYNPISVAADLDSILSKNGVSADFFSKYPFTAFLDNSTGHWKSRQGPLKSMTPEQRLSWYLKPILEGKFGHDDAVQYREFCAPITADFTNHRIANDEPNLPYNLAASWNQAIREKVFKGLDKYNGSQPIEPFLIDLTVTKDYSQILEQVKTQAAAVQQQRLQAQKIDALEKQVIENAAPLGKNNKTLIIGGIVVAVVIVIVFIVKGK